MQEPAKLFRIRVFVPSSRFDNAIDTPFNRKLGEMDLFG